MTSFGVIAPSARTEPALTAGVDYVEPAIAGNVAVADGAGWRLAPEYEGRRHPSFAILFPGDLRVSDPGFPAERVTAYVDAVLPLVASVAERGAKIVFRRPDHRHDAGELGSTCAACEQLLSPPETFHSTMKTA